MHMRDDIFSSEIRKRVYTVHFYLYINLKVFIFYRCKTTMNTILFHWQQFWLMKIQTIENIVALWFLLATKILHLY